MYVVWLSLVLVSLPSGRKNSFAQYAILEMDGNKETAKTLLHQSNNGNSEHFHDHFILSFPSFRCLSLSLYLRTRAGWLAN
jgi:hypothetical protein